MNITTTITIVAYGHLENRGEYDVFIIDEPQEPDNFGFGN